MSDYPSWIRCWCGHHEDNHDSRHGCLTERIDPTGCYAVICVCARYEEARP